MDTPIDDLFESQERLRIEFIDAFKASTERDWNFAAVKVYPDNPIIKAVHDDLKLVLKQSEKYADECDKNYMILDFRVIYKLLRPSPGDKPIAPKTANKLLEYIYWVKRKKRKQIAQKHSMAIRGAHIIDETFLDLKRRAITKDSIIDFYTHKGNEDLQWSGIINGFDVKRPLLPILKKEVFLAFNSNRNSKICAAILSYSGSGKSTLLRRLAIDLVLNPNFILLWLTDILEFTKTLEEETLNPERKYLIIIQDWNDIETHTAVMSNFIGRISQMDNVRVIVADNNTNPGIYAEHIYGENVFYLNTEDNLKVITEIIQKSEIPELLLIFDSLYRSSKEIFHAPLYVLLFVLFRTLEDATKEYDLDSKDWLGQFNKIVKNDLAAIYNEYPGLAQTLYYWACIHLEFGTQITLEALLEIADNYSGNLKSSSELISRNRKSSVWKILSHYFSVEELIHPDCENKHLLNFHHGLLVKALTIPYNTNWYFDTEIKLEIVGKLIDLEEFDIASDLYLEASLAEKRAADEKFKKLGGGVIFSYGSPKYNSASFKSMEQERRISETLVRHRYSFNMKLWANERLKSIYDRIKKPCTDIEIKTFVSEVIFYFNSYPYTLAYYKIFSKLIELGCNSPIVKYAHGMSMHDETIYELVDDVMFGSIEDSYSFASRTFDD